MRPNPEELQPVYTGNMTFDLAGQLIAGSRSQWVKITNPKERHFSGNWTAKTLLEIAVGSLPAPKPRSIEKSDSFI